MKILKTKFKDLLVFKSKNFYDKRGHFRELALKKKLKNKNISEDDNEKFEKEIQKITDLNIENIEKILAEKEKEISQI